MLYLCSVQYEGGDGGYLNVVECTMAFVYRQKIESGEIEEWGIGQE